MLSNALDIALRATRQAVELCSRVQSSIAPESLEKKDKSPVTVADFGSQALIAKALADAFPNIPLIAEEDSADLRSPQNSATLLKVVDEVRKSSNQDKLSAESICQWIDHGSAQSYSELYWTLDPIDGTKGFLRKEQYAIALALVEKGVPVLAALACPNLPDSNGGIGSIFYAEEGKAYCLGLDGQAATPIAVSSQSELFASRFCESVESGHSNHSQSAAIAKLLGIEGESVRMDSQAKYAAVARGDAEFYLRLPTRPGYVEKIWDHAAGYAVLKGAGGQITDVDGKDLDFRHGIGLKENRGVVASCGLAHEKLIEAIQKTS